MNEIKTFTNNEFGEVRTVMIDGEPYFVGKDVASILGYERATKAIRDHVDDEDIDAVPIQDSIGRMQNTPVISESGVYSLILSSKLTTAKRFKRWVTSEVLLDRYLGKRKGTAKKLMEGISPLKDGRALRYSAADVAERIVYGNA